MARSPVPVNFERSAEALAREIEKFNERVRERAFEIASRAGAGGAIDHWLQAERESYFRPPIRLAETKDGYVLETAAPGFDKKDLEVRVGDGRIVIRGEKHGASQRQDGRALVAEYRDDVLFREATLPLGADPGRAKATLADGVLTVTVPFAKPQPAAKTPAAPQARAPRAVQPKAAAPRRRAGRKTR